MTISEVASENGTALLLRWNIPAWDVPRLDDLRRALAAAVDDLEEDPVVELKLVCTELASNVHLHAGTGGELRLTRPYRDVIYIEVDDGSPEPPRIASGTSGQRRCHGLDIVDAVAKQWGVRRRDGGKTVWVEVNVPNRSFD